MWVNGLKSIVHVKRQTVVNGAVFNTQAQGSDFTLADINAGTFGVGGCFDAVFCQGAMMLFSSAETIWRTLVLRRLKLIIV